MHCFGEVSKSDSGSSLLSARNTSVMIPNLSVNCEVQFSVLENQPAPNSVHIMVVCSSVALEKKRVQDTLSALPVHRQSCRMKSTVELN